MKVRRGVDFMKPRAGLVFFVIDNRLIFLMSIDIMVGLSL